MKFITTITTKGQVVVPKSVRDKLGIKPGDKMSFVVDKNKIIAEPVYNIDEVYGMFKVAKPITKKRQQRIIENEIAKKFGNK